MIGRGLLLAWLFGRVTMTCCLLSLSLPTATYESGDSEHERVRPFTKPVSEVAAKACSRHGSGLAMPPSRKRRRDLQGPTGNLAGDQLNSS